MTRQLLKAWIKQLSKPNPKFGGMPECPFARSAMEQGKVVLKNCYQSLAYHIWLVDDKGAETDKVYLLMFDTDWYSAGEIDGIVDYYNRIYLHLLILAAHPKHDEPSHPTLGLVFIQRKADMIAAVDYLRTTAYYDNNPLPEWYLETDMSRRSLKGEGG